MLGHALKDTARERRRVVLLALVLAIVIVGVWVAIASGALGFLLDPDPEGLGSITPTLGPEQS